MDRWNHTMIVNELEEERDEAEREEDCDGATKDDLQRLTSERDRNDQRFKSDLERIFDKYEHDFTGIGDEIDVITGELVVNNGHLQNIRNEGDPGTRSSSRFAKSLGQGFGAEHSDDEYDGIQGSEGENNEGEDDEGEGDEAENEGENGFEKVPGEDDDGSEYVESSGQETDTEDFLEETSQDDMQELSDEPSALDSDTDLASVERNATLQSFNTFARPAPRLAHLLLSQGKTLRRTGSTRTDMPGSTRLDAEKQRKVEIRAGNSRQSALNQTFRSFDSKSVSGGLDADAIKALGMSIANGLAQMMSVQPSEKRKRTVERPSAREKAWWYPEPGEVPSTKLHEPRSQLKSRVRQVSPEQESLWAVKGEKRRRKRRRFDLDESQARRGPTSKNLNHSRSLGLGQETLGNQRELNPCDTSHEEPTEPRGYQGESAEPQRYQHQPSESSTVKVRNETSQETQLNPAKCQRKQEQKRYTEEEDNLIVKLRSQGVNWKEVTRQLPGRARKSLENHWFMKLKNRTAALLDKSQGDTPAAVDESEVSINESDRDTSFDRGTRIDEVVAGASRPEGLARLNPSLSSQRTSQLEGGHQRTLDQHMTPGGQVGKVDTHSANMAVPRSGASEYDGAPIRHLVRLAFLAHGSKQAVKHSQIIHWIHENYPGLENHRPAWVSNVSTNLSAHKEFQRGDYGFWVLNEKLMGPLIWRDAVKRPKIGAGSTSTTEHCQGLEDMPDTRLNSEMDHEQTANTNSVTHEQMQSKADMGSTELCRQQDALHEVDAANTAERWDPSLRKPTQHDRPQANVSSKRVDQTVRFATRPRSVPATSEPVVPLWHPEVEHLEYGECQNAFRGQIDPNIKRYTRSTDDGLGTMSFANAKQADTHRLSCTEKSTNQLLDTQTGSQATSAALSSFSPLRSTQKSKTPLCGSMDAPVMPAAEAKNTPTEHGPGHYVFMGRQADMVCYICRATSTPVWRRDQAGRRICNACGTYHRLHGHYNPDRVKKATAESPRGGALTQPGPASTARPKSSSPASSDCEPPEKQSQISVVAGTAELPKQDVTEPGADDSPSPSPLDVSSAKTGSVHASNDNGPSSLTTMDVGAEDNSESNGPISSSSDPASPVGQASKTGSSSNFKSTGDAPSSSHETDAVEHASAAVGHTTCKSTGSAPSSSASAKTPAKHLRRSIVVPGSSMRRIVETPVRVIDDSEDELL